MAQCIIRVADHGAIAFGCAGDDRSNEHRLIRVTRLDHLFHMIREPGWALRSAHLFATCAVECACTNKAKHDAKCQRRGKENGRLRCDIH
jgi:hypothetical protein